MNCTAEREEQINSNKNQVNEGMELLLKKVYTVSSKNDPETPRVWLQSLVCRRAGFEKGQILYVSMDEVTKEITIQTQPISIEDTQVSVSGRKVGNGDSPYVQPLVDTASNRYKSIIRVRQKVEISVYRNCQNLESKVVIRPLVFNLFEKETFVKATDNRISVLSVCAGAGFGTAAFEETGAFTSVGAIELEDDSAEVFTHNFPSSYLFNGDLRDVSTLPKADITLATLPCNESSSLGHGLEGVMNDLILAASEIIRTAESRIVFFENVPQWYKSDSYRRLQALLKEDYPYWSEKTLESHEFTSIARRKRGYACAFRSKEDFLAFEFPKPPKSPRRKKLREFFNKSDAQNYEWKSVDSWKKNFNDRGKNGGSWKDRSLEKTFVASDATELQCIPKRYTSQTASNSYVLSDDRKSFRFLTIQELMKIFRVPAWFSLTENIGKIRSYEMIGQSVDGGIFQAIGNKIAEVFFKNRKNTVKEESKYHLQLNSNEQLGFVF
ncbi:DNA cytosine methyltransferase [Sporosarcina sp. FSL K6-1508]|uniref:DNA cytosine methyltransferase n=1 Tax=Sporosarcina sp. FSL K6-1508 TaxID=2921553 RepID=UPI0030F54701